MSAPIKALLYLVSLYAWWCLCAHFFEVDIPPPPQQLRQPQARATFADPPAGHAAAQSTASTATMATAVQPAAVAIPGVERPSHIIKCPPNRRPFHTLLTAQGTVYNQWQARIMYHHWLKQRALQGRCGERSRPGLLVERLLWPGAIEGERIVLLEQGDQLCRAQGAVLVVIKL